MTVPDSIIFRLRGAVDRMPDGLRDHVVRVEFEAVALARRYGVDLDRVRLAVLGHDLARAESFERLFELCGEHGIVPDEVERMEPVLLHGPVAGSILKSEYGIDDVEVLAAATFHTTARPGMSRLEKVLFLADKIEEEKVRRRPEWARVRDLAPADLDAALRCFFDLHIEEAIARGWHLHPRTVTARNELLPAGAAGIT